MKQKTMLVLVLLALLLAGCRKTNDADCATNWRHMEVDPGDEAMVVDLIMERHHLPDTVGEYLQECLEEGYRPSGL
jgi:nitrous oxide reductase accessory protein NosL